MAIIVSALALPGIIAPRYFAFFVPPYASDLARDEELGLLACLVIAVGWLLVVVLRFGWFATDRERVKTLGD